MKKTLIRLATVFSGIGSVEFALKRLNIPYDIIFACDNGERDIVYDEAKEKNIIRAAYAFEQSREFVNWSLNGKEEK